MTLGWSPYFSTCSSVKPYLTHHFEWHLLPPQIWCFAPIIKPTILPRRCFAFTEKGISLAFSAAPYLLKCGENVPRAEGRQSGHSSGVVNRWVLNGEHLHWKPRFSRWFFAKKYCPVDLQIFLQSSWCHGFFRWNTIKQGRLSHLKWNYRGYVMLRANTR